MRIALFLAALAASPLVCAGSAGATPDGFPDVDAYPAVDPADYKVFGARPSTSGWLFSTPAGLRCQASLIAELGVSCQDLTTVAGVSLTKAAEFGVPDDAAEPRPSRLLPVGFKIAADNGVVCAVVDDETLACRASKPDSWAADTPDPPDRHYGEHGFVVGAAGHWGY
jgi:hypothetical protein